MLSEDAEISTLPNGLRVVTLPSHSPIASVGVFVDTGSRYETPDLSGITHFLEVMSLKSTVNRTDFRLVREMLKMGANVSAASSREHFMYAADCLKEHVPAICGTLADVIQNHIFHIEELLEEKEMYEQELKDKDKMMELKLLEAIHEAAWNNNTVGLPLYAPPHNLPYFTSETLKQYQRTYFTPKRMVVTAIGYEHQQLVDLVQATFTSLPPDVIDPSSRQPAQYTGGDVRIHKKGDEGLVHIALAFETANWHDKDLLPMCVLQLLMGGGGSFSAGGPGKGMYSRLYNNILNKYDWAESASSFNAIYNDTAIFGIYGTSQTTANTTSTQHSASHSSTHSAAHITYYPLCHCRLVCFVCVCSCARQGQEPGGRAGEGVSGYERVYRRRGAASRQESAEVVYTHAAGEQSHAAGGHRSAGDDIRQVHHSPAARTAGRQHHSGRPAASGGCDDQDAAVVRRHRRPLVHTALRPHTAEIHTTQQRQQQC